MVREINLFEDIVAGYTAINFINQLNQLGSGLPITVNINSGGGSLLEAFAIYDYLNSPSGKKYTIEGHVYGLAASAATPIAIACNALIGDNAYFMIHDAYMPERDMTTGEIVLVEDMNVKLAKIYSAKTGLEYGKVREMMKVETFMDSKAAVDLGFCKGYVKGLAIAAKSLQAITAWKGLVENKTFSGYPETAVANAQQALAWVEQHGLTVDALTIARAKQIANRLPLSPDSVTHISNCVEPTVSDEKPWENIDYVNWLLNGGVSAKAWANTQNKNVEIEIRENSIVEKLANKLNITNMNILDRIKALATGTVDVTNKMVDEKLYDGTPIVIETDETGVAKAGDKVTLADGKPVEDAPHLLSDGKTIVKTEGGIITAIEEKEADVAEDAEAKAGLELLATMLGELTSLVKEQNSRLDAVEAKVNIVNKAPKVEAKARTPQAPKDGKETPSVGGHAFLVKYGNRMGIPVH